MRAESGLKLTSDRSLGLHLARSRHLSSPRILGSEESCWQGLCDAVLQKTAECFSRTWRQILILITVEKRP